MAVENHLKVCSPVPYFPILAPGKELIKDEQHEFMGIETFRPGFFYFPKILKSYDALFYKKGLKSWFCRVIEEWKPDILDSHFIWPDGVAVSMLAKEFNLPFSITLRGKIYESIKIPAQRKQCEKALKRADLIISVSGKMAEEAVKLGADHKRIKIIPNGVKKEIFHKRNKKESRIKLGLPHDKKIMVTIAHLGKRKGHYEVIKALKKLPEDILLVLIGGEAQGGTREELLKAAKENSVEKKLIIKGPRPYEEIPEYLSAADLSILASYREGCPNAVLESLACGTPVVATDVGAVKDILPAPQCGEIVPLKNQEALEKAIAGVLEKDWDKDSVIEQSMVRSWKEVGDEVVKEFRQI